MTKKESRLSLPDDIRHYLLLAKGHYLIHANEMLEACQDICESLYGIRNVTAVLSDLIRIRAMCCADPDVIQVEEEATSWKHLVDGLPTILASPKHDDPQAAMLELVVQSLLVPLMRYRVPDGYCLGDPDCKTLNAIDPKFEKKEAEAYV